MKRLGGGSSLHMKDNGAAGVSFMYRPPNHIYIQDNVCSPKAGVCRLVLRIMDESTEGCTREEVGRTEFQI